MSDPLFLALVLAVGLIALGAVTGLIQWRGLRELAERKHVPSDEHAYLRSRYRRRLFTGCILMTIGTLIGGAYLSGMERHADELKAEPAPPLAEEPADKPRMTDEQKQFVRLWGLYWIVILLLVFGLMSLAVTDAWSSRRYWMTQLRQLREDHQTRLRRDLAVHRQHQEQTRAGRLGNHRTDGGDSETVG